MEVTIIYIYIRTHDVCKKFSGTNIPSSTSLPGCIAPPPFIPVTPCPVTGLSETLIDVFKATPTAACVTAPVATPNNTNGSRTKIIMRWGKGKQNGRQFNTTCLQASTSWRPPSTSRSIHAGAGRYACTHSTTPRSHILLEIQSKVWAECRGILWSGGLNFETISNCPRKNEITTIKITKHQTSQNEQDRKEYTLRGKLSFFLVPMPHFVNWSPLKPARRRRLLLCSMEPIRKWQCPT